MILAGLFFLSHRAQSATTSVVCLGDSLAAQLSLPAQTTLGEKFSVSSSAYDPSKVEKNLGAKLASAKIVLLCVGTDAAKDSHWIDKRDSFVPNVEGAIDQLRGAANHPRVFLCLPPPANLASTDPRKVRLETQVVPLIKQVARESDCPIIDFESALGDRTDLMTGLVPNELGVQLLADTVSDAIYSGRKADWKVVFADSEETDEGPAKNAIDGDPETYWHTNYSSTQEKYPHEIQVDTGMERTIGGFSYLPRQDATNGRVAKYEFYVSLDGKDWGTAVAKGQFRRGSELTKVFFPQPVKCRYFKFKALSEEQGQIWTTVAELDILKFYPKRK